MSYRDLGEILAERGVAVDQPEPSIQNQQQFMFCSPARFAPLLSITTLSGKPLLPIARVKKAVAAASSRCSEDMKSRVFPNLLMHMGWFDWLKSPPRTNRPIKVNEPKLLNIEEFATENDNLIKGWQLCVTMNTETPLEWLQRHGERAEKPFDVPPSFASWVPEIKSFKELGFDVSEVPESTMASQFGQIPTNGGEFLVFLKAYRSAVEASAPETKRLEDLKSLGDNYPAIVKNLGGDLIEFFCLKELQSELSCSHGVASKLFQDGLISSSKVRESSLGRICSIKGIGKETAEKLLS